MIIIFQQLLLQAKAKEKALEILKDFTKKVSYFKDWRESMLLQNIIVLGLYLTQKREPNDRQQL